MACISPAARDSVINAGTIIGTNGDGVYMGTNGSVNNLIGGIITGGNNGVEIAGTGYVANAGTITGHNRDGVYMGTNGSVNNLTAGSLREAPMAWRSPAQVPWSMPARS